MLNILVWVLCVCNTKSNKRMQWLQSWTMLSVDQMSHKWLWFWVITCWDVQFSQRGGKLVRCLSISSPQLFLFSPLISHLLQVRRPTVKEVLPLHSYVLMTPWRRKWLSLLPLTEDVLDVLTSVIPDWSNERMNQHDSKAEDNGQRRGHTKMFLLILCRMFLWIQLVLF